MKAQSEGSVPSDHLPAQAGKASLRSAGREPACARLPYQPGIDGLRAVAVTAVLLYHADVLWMPGGFLGVEVFFVISGYLITALLLAEWEREGWIDLKAFWLRRARRLLPALFFLLAATLAFAVLFLPEEVASLRSDAASAVTYVTNWYLIFSQKPYFETVGRPSLLRHLWSLAIEEQFYLIWPVLLSLAVGRWRGQRLLPVILTGAAASALLASILYQPDLDPSRVYYGTDTRASGLLIGAALALIIKPCPEEDRVRKIAAPWLEVGGLAALAALAGLCLWVSEFHPFLYRGALPAVGLSTAILIGVIIHPRTSLVPRLLGGRFLVWMGRRSYGIYLWHWPVFMVTRPQLDVPLTGPALLALRLGLTMLLAEFSYRVVEDPIRSGALERAWVSLSEARGARRWRFAIEWAISVAVLLIFCISLSVPLVRAQPPEPPSYLPVDSINTISSAGVDRETAATATPTPSAVSLPEPELDASPTALLTSDPPLASMLPALGPLVATQSPAVLPPAPVVISSQSRTQPTPTPPVTVTPTDHDDRQDRDAPVRQGPVSPSVGGTSGQGALDVLMQPLQGSTLNALPTTAPSPSAAVHPAVLQATQLPERPTTTLAEAALPSQNQRIAPPTPELPPTPTPTAVSVGRVTAIGDSVMLSAASELERTIPEVEIDTEVGRQVADVVPILQKYRDAGRLGDIVLVHLGNNGAFRPKQIDQIMDILGSERRVIFVNNKVPRSWENYNNRVLSEGVQQYANAVLIDWHIVSISQPELFWADGYHMRPEGAQFYVDLMAAQIREP